MNYDFIVFESYHLATHHIYDMILIARMLKSQGKTVAIFDIYHEIPENSKENIPVIHWTSKCGVPDDKWRLRKHSVFETGIKFVTFCFQQKKYMNEALSFIKDKASAFYCGSYHNGMSTVFFQLQKPCYWWGLRSERLHFSYKKVLISPIHSIQVLLERRRFIRNPYQRLFVSNQIIMEEHNRLGIPLDRMIIREERVVEHTTDANLSSLDNNISFLVIGQLRKAKHIPTTIEAFRHADIPDAKLKLIGRAQEEYEKVIEHTINGDNRILRRNEYLEYDDFYKNISKSHFVLFADEAGPSCITNGTMTEALINHRPIICPDYNPYKYYVEKYGFGILYKSGDTDSYAKAMRKGAELGVRHFLPAIEKFLNEIQFDVVSKNFVDEINKQMSADRNVYK